MDEQFINSVKETLIFLVEQERLRGEEVKALNEKIEAVNSTLMDSVINPGLEAYENGRYEDFKGKYGERLSKFDNILKNTQNDPDYDTVRQTYDGMSELNGTEGFDEGAYVDDVEAKLNEFCTNVKKALGISEDTPIEVKQDADGTTEVKADENGDGTAETTVTETTETTAEPKVEEKKDKKRKSWLDDAAEYLKYIK